MDSGPVADADGRLDEAVTALADAVGPAAVANELVAALGVCESTTRRLDLLAVRTVADLQRRGMFAERGYRSPINALSDLLGWERFEARRRVLAAENVCPRVGLDGQTLPPRLETTARLFEAGECGLRHVEAIAKVLDSGAARRLEPQVWASAEARLAEMAPVYAPTQLQSWGTELVELLDQDGARPDDRPPPQINELTITRYRTGSGGRIVGRFDDAAIFDAIATAVDAAAKPRGSDDMRSTGERQAEALADVCAQVIERGVLPESGGRRPVLSVQIRLEDLENRARAAALDFGGTLHPATLRMLACDAAVIPIVLGGKGQPLDVGRATRTVPDGLRRAVIARDGGCAFPSCDRPPSWCEVHHIKEWELGGETALSNLVTMCKVHHRLLHHTPWEVRLGEEGLPEFIPPYWIDRNRTPRRKPPPLLCTA